MLRPFFLLFGRCKANFANTDALSSSDSVMWNSCWHQYFPFLPRTHLSNCKLPECVTANRKGGRRLRNRSKLDRWPCYVTVTEKKRPVFWYGTAQLHVIHILPDGIWLGKHNFGRLWLELGLKNWPSKEYYNVTFQKMVQRSNLLRYAAERMEWKKRGEFNRFGLCVWSNQFRFDSLYEMHVSIISFRFAIALQYQIARRQSNNCNSCCTLGGLLLYYNEAVRQKRDCQGKSTWGGKVKA